MAQPAPALATPDATVNISGRAPNREVIDIPAYGTILFTTTDPACRLNFDNRRIFVFGDATVYAGTSGTMIKAQVDKGACRFTVSDASSEGSPQGPPYIINVGGG